MNLLKLKDVLGKEIENLGYHLYDIEFVQADQILTIYLDESLDLDKIEKVSNDISIIMDKYDEDLPKYLLDVTCVGVERPIRNEDELKKAVGSYIYVKTKEKEYNGDLLSYEDQILTLQFKDKNISKKIKINFSEIKKMRYAVKF